MQSFQQLISVLWLERPSILPVGILGETCNGGWGVVWFVIEDVRCFILYTRGHGAYLPHSARLDARSEATS